MIMLILMVSACSVARAGEKKDCIVNFGAPMDVLVLQLDEFYHDHYEAYKSLRSRLPCEIGLRFYKRCDDVIEALEKGEVDMVGSRIACYIRARKKLGVKPVFSVSLDGKLKHRGVLLVRKDSGYESIADLKGARFSAVSSDSIIYHYFPWKYVWDNTGIKLRDFIGEVIKCPSIMASINSVIMGESDAVMADEEFLKLEEVKSVMKPIAYTFEIPYPVMYSPAVFPEHVKATIDMIVEGLNVLPDETRVGNAFSLNSGIAVVEDPEYEDFVKVLKEEGLLERITAPGAKHDSPGGIHPSD